MIIKDKVQPNILTFDIEEWFQVANFSEFIKESEWDNYESHIEDEINSLLNTLREFNIKATFFIVGWVAERHPKMIEKIQKDDHEIGIHGYLHKNIIEETPLSFAQDLRKAVKIVSDIASKQIKCYRAPSYTMTPKTVWALDILHEHGIEYDSSIFPINGHPLYGFPNAPRYPFRFKNGLKEFPISTFRIGSMVFPFGSGAYFRIMPYFFTYFIMKVLNKNGRSQTVNIHPWEMDPEQKVIRTNWFKQFRHCFNLSKNRDKFYRYISDFKFMTIHDFKEQYQFPLMEIENGQFRRL